MPVKISVKKLSLAIVLLAGFAQAGTIVTIEGKRYIGDLKKTAEGWNVTAADGTVTEVPANRVMSFDLGSANPVGEMDKLNSLRRSIEALDDIPKIIARYKRFIEQMHDPKTIEEANKDLAGWQDKLDHSLVKVGKEWITVEERQKRAIDSIAKISDARDLIKAGKTADALKVLADVQQMDPSTPSVAYLQGVIALKQEKLADAKKSFILVQQSLNDHAPTLMNLAIINARLKQWSLSAGQAEMSLTASPGMQILVDNSAELFNALPSEIKKSAAGQKLAKRFAEQDEQLQSQMAQKQLYRWGAKWVDRDTREKLAQAEADVKKRLDELQGDFDITQNRISRIDQEVSENENSMESMQSGSYTRLSNGTYVQLPLPSTYYDLERDNNKLKAEKQEMIKRLDALKAAAKRARDQVPMPKYSGVLHPIEEDGVPIVVPAGVKIDFPTTKPQVKSTPTTQPEAQMIIKIGPADDDAK